MASSESKVAPSEGKFCDSFNMLFMFLVKQGIYKGLPFFYVENQEFMPERSN